MSSPLFDAFKDDHAILGRGFFDISQCLRGGDIDAARARADKVDLAAGAHIAFEEECFYPALRRLLGDEEVDRLHDEHGEGLTVLRALALPGAGDELDEEKRRELLGQSELMERHIAECGELFGAMGRIPPDEQERLYRELLAWRKKAPRWTSMSSTDGPGDERA